jgi:hypothetical protein
LVAPCAPSLSLECGEEGRGTRCGNPIPHGSFFVKENEAETGIPHSVPWRRIRVALRARFYRHIRLGRGKSLGERIFGVVFWGDSAKISSRKQSCPFALWIGLGESL